MWCEPNDRVRHGKARVRHGFGLVTAYCYLPHYQVRANMMGLDTARYTSSLNCAAAIARGGGVRALFLGLTYAAYPPNCAWAAYSRLSYLHRAWPATELRVPPALPAGRASGECSSRSASPSPSSNRHPYLLLTTYCGCTYYLLLTTNYQSCSPSSSRYRVPSTSSCDLKGW